MILSEKAILICLHNIVAGLTCSDVRQVDIITGLFAINHGQHQQIIVTIMLMDRHHTTYMTKREKLIGDIIRLAMAATQKTNGVHRKTPSGYMCLIRETQIQE